MILASGLSVTLESKMTLQKETIPLPARLKETNAEYPRTIRIYMNVFKKLEKLC
jgi:hypothetical protein